MGLEEILVIAMFASFMGLLLLGFPVAWSLAGIGLLFAVLGYVLVEHFDANLWFTWDGTIGVLDARIYGIVANELMVALPLFIFMGIMLDRSGIAERLMHSLVRVLGPLRGGYAVTVVVVGILLAASTGIVGASVALLGMLSIGPMLQANYNKSLAVGTACSVGTLGILIPPSIMLVLMADRLGTSEASVGKLFMAGVIPGIMLGLVLMIAIYIVARIKKLPALPRASFREWLRAAREAFWGLLLMVIILGGIYSGMFTPTEAAAVAAVYSAFVALFVYKDITLRDCPKVLLESGKLSIMLMFIIANAMLFAHVLTTEQIPKAITAWVIEAGLQPWMFLLVVNIVLLVAGAFMEPSAIILILAPILFPIAMQLGIDPIHLGIIMVVNMEIGLITPPVGLNLFVASAVTGMPVTQVIRAVLPWLALMLSFLVIITYVPSISLALPNWLGM